MIAVYTANIGDKTLYDHIQNYPVYNTDSDEVEYHYYYRPALDRGELDEEWIQHEVEFKPDDGTGVTQLTGRWYKLHPFDLFDAEYVIWVDANVKLLTDPVDIVDKYLLATNADIATISHPDRDSVYKEAKQCIAWNKGDPDKIRLQVVRMHLTDYPMSEHWLACSFILVCRNVKRIRQMYSLWWDDITEYSIRDQISFPYVCWKLGIEPHWIPGNHYEGPDYKRTALH